MYSFLDTTAAFTATVVVRLISSGKRDCRVIESSDIVIELKIFLQESGIYIL